MVEKVCIGIYAKECSMTLPRLFKALKELTYPKDKLRIVFLYSQSSDNTLELIKKEAAEGWVRISMFAELNSDDMLRVAGMNAGMSLYNDWKAAMEADEEYFMYIDPYIITLQTDLIEKLIEVDADIVAPYPWGEEHAYFFDTWGFRINNVRFDAKNPPGKGLDYPVVVESVGTCFLVKKATFMSSNITNPYPNITFCNNARKMGYSVVACPYLEIVRCSTEKFGLVSQALPAEAGGYPQEGFLDDSFPVKKFQKVDNACVNADLNSFSKQFTDVKDDKGECE